MSTTQSRLLGYLSEWSARPGDSVDLHAARLGSLPSTSSWRPRISITRLDGAAVGHTAVVTDQSTTLPVEQLPCGSFLRIEALPVDSRGLNVGFWMCAGVVDRAQQDVVECVFASHDEASSSGFTVVLQADRQLRLDLGPETWATGLFVPPGTWVLVVVDVFADMVQLRLTGDSEDSTRSRSFGRGDLVHPGGTACITIGSSTAARGRTTLSGRIEDVTVARGVALLTVPPSANERLTEGVPARDLIAAWDFARLAGRISAGPGPAVEHLACDSSRVPLHVVNNPANRLPGHAGRPDASVHLSADDLDDACWPVIARISLGPDEPSGVLGVQVEAGDDVVTLPLVVAALPGGKGPRPLVDRGDRALLVLPTFTYLAYANHRQASEQSFFGDYRHVRERPVVLDDANTFLNSLPGLGASLYDRRPDGTAAMFSSRRRPVINIDPDYRWWMTDGPRHFPADLRFLQWLNAESVPVDVVTDEEVHIDGRDLLDGYRVVLTGSHPEYVSRQMYDAVEGHVRDGGRLMYLGGNGFYWEIGFTQDARHRIEIRRSGDGGWWSVHEGEDVMRSSNAPGGLWSLRGRPAHALLGVTFAAQGWGRAAGYRRLPASRDDRCSFVFEGVDDEVFGVEGDVLGGAAGDEIDCHDYSVTESGTTVLATSEGRHPDLFLAAAGEPRPGFVPRSDVVLHRVAPDGWVFSVGSIAWTASVTWNDGQNPVARITKNVIRRFLDPRPVEAGAR